MSNVHLCQLVLKYTNIARIFQCSIQCIKNICICMIHLFVRIAYFHSIFRKELYKIKMHKSINNQKIKRYFKVHFNSCTESAWLIYLFKMWTCTIFRVRISKKSKSIKVAKIFQSSFNSWVRVGYPLYMLISKRFIKKRKPSNSTLIFMSVQNLPVFFKLHTFTSFRKRVWHN